MEKNSLVLSIMLVATMFLVLFVFIISDYISNTTLAQLQPSTNNQSYHFVGSFGSFGIEKGQFYGPQDIAIDSFGNVYVADSMNSRIQKFDNNGNFVTSWGSQGSDKGEFNKTFYLTTDNLKNV
jgi:DNA-binding beta-propeller fold protein YncE